MTKAIIDNAFIELIRAAVVARDEAEDADDFRARLCSHLGASRARAGVVVLPALDTEESDAQAAPEGPGAEA